MKYLCVHENRYVETCGIGLTLKEAYDNFRESDDSPADELVFYELGKKLDVEFEIVIKQNPKEKLPK